MQRNCIHSDGGTSQHHHLTHAGRLYVCCLIIKSNLHFSTKRCLLLSLHIVPVGSPQNLSAVPVDSSTLLISWTPPEFALQNGLIRSYNLSIYETETTTRTHLPLEEVLSVSVSDLHPFYNYEVEIAAGTIGDGPFSSSVQVQLPESCMSSSTIHRYEHTECIV